MGQIDDLQMRIGTIGKSILAYHRASQMSHRLQTIPGIGVITATAIAATVADANVFKSGRHFAAWIDLVPRQIGTGGRIHLGPISRKGDPYLRKLLVLGASRYSLRQKQARTSCLDQWIARKTTSARRHSRGCKQTGADRLGRDEPGRDVPPSLFCNRLRQHVHKLPE